MQAGRLQTKLRLERPVLTETPSGGSIKTWAPVQIVHADMVPWKGYERAVYNSVGNWAITRFQIRWSQKIRDLNATWRAVRIDRGRDGAILDIQFVLNVREQNETFEITANLGLTYG